VGVSALRRQGVVAPAERGNPRGLGAVRGWEGWLGPFLDRASRSCGWEPGTEAAVNCSQGLDGESEDSRAGRPRSFTHCHGMHRFVDPGWQTGCVACNAAFLAKREAVGCLVETGPCRSTI
jgi:hypothetical protein